MSLFTKEWNQETEVAWDRDQREIWNKDSKFHANIVFLARWHTALRLSSWKGLKLFSQRACQGPILKCVFGKTGRTSALFRRCWRKMLRRSKEIDNDLFQYNWDILGKDALLGTIKWSDVALQPDLNLGEMQQYSKGIIFLGVHFF